MGLQQVLLNVGKGLINRAGIMTERQMLAATTRAGRYVRDALEKGELSSELAGDIIKKSLPKGIKPPTLITMSTEEATSWIAKTGIHDEKVISAALLKAYGFYGANPKNMKTLLWLNPQSADGNIVAHELRHYFDGSTTVSKKIQKIFAKILTKLPFVQKRLKSLASVTESAFVDIENTILHKSGILAPNEKSVLKYAPTKEGLLQMMGVSEEEVSKFFSAKVNNLLHDKSPKDKIAILKALIFNMKTEVNAQMSGAKITRAMGHFKINESCCADMSSIFHGEVMKILENELSKQRKNYCKSLLGFKIPKDEITKAELKTKTEIKFDVFSGLVSNEKYARRIAAANSGASCKSVTTLEELRKEQATIKKFGKEFLDDTSVSAKTPEELSKLAQVLKVN